MPFLRLQMLTWKRAQLYSQALDTYNVKSTRLFVLLEHHESDGGVVRTDIRDQRFRSVGSKCYCIASCLAALGACASCFMPGGKPLFSCSADLSGGQDGMSSFVIKPLPVQGDPTSKKRVCN